MLRKPVAFAAGLLYSGAFAASVVNRGQAPVRVGRELVRLLFRERFASRIGKEAERLLLRRACEQGTAPLFKLAPCVQCGHPLKRGLARRRRAGFAL